VCVCVCVCVFQEKMAYAAEQQAFYISKALPQLAVEKEQPHPYQPAPLLVLISLGPRAGILVTHKVCSFIFIGLLIGNRIKGACFIGERGENARQKLSAGMPLT